MVDILVTRPQRALTSKAGRNGIALCTWSRWSTKVFRERDVPLRGIHSRSTPGCAGTTHDFCEDRQQASLHSQLSVDRRALTDAPMIQHLPEERMQLSAPYRPAIVSGWRRLRSTTLRTCSGSPSNADPIRAMVAAQDRGEIGENNLLAVVFGRTRRQHRHEHRADPLQPGGVRREP